MRTTIRRTKTKPIKTKPVSNPLQEKQQQAKLIKKEMAAIRDNTPFLQSCRFSTEIIQRISGYDINFIIAGFPYKLMSGNGTGKYSTEVRQLLDIIKSVIEKTGIHFCHEIRFNAYEETEK
jgi:hypothetical protein